MLNRKLSATECEPQGKRTLQSFHGGQYFNVTTAKQYLGINRNWFHQIFLDVINETRVSVFHNGKKT